MLKIFQLNEYEWWTAETLEDALEVACEESGLSLEEVSDSPTELTDDELDKLKFFYDPYSKDEFCTFRERFEYLSKNGKLEPGLFACTEW
jgi:hypothetical protein